MSEPIPRCFTNLIDSLRKSILGSNEIHTLVWECKCDKKSGYAITGDESRRWLGFARSKIIDGGLDSAGFYFGIQPRIFLRTWISKHVSGPIAEDVNRCILKLENHREHLWCLIRCVKSGEGLKWEGEKFRRVLYYWRSREIEIIAVLFELLKSIDFAMGWGLDKPSHPFYWQEYEKHPQAETIAADDGVLSDGLYRADALFVWDGKRYEWLTDTMMDVLELLYKSYPDAVKPSAIENKISVIPEGGFKKVFRVNRKDQKGLHGVASIVGGRASTGWYLMK